MSQLTELRENRQEDTGLVVGKGAERFVHFRRILARVRQGKDGRIRGRARCVVLVVYPRAVHLVLDFLKAHELERGRVRSREK